MYSILTSMEYLGPWNPGVSIPILLCTIVAFDLYNIDGIWDFAMMPMYLQVEALIHLEDVMLEVRTIIQK